MDNQTTEGKPLQTENAEPLTPAQPRTDAAKKKTRANVICGISLGLLLAAILAALGAGYTFFVLPFELQEKLRDLFFYLIVAAVAAYEASFVLMIIARVYFRESRFAKATFWIHMSLLILVGVAFIAFIAFCFYTCASCHMPG